MTKKMNGFLFKHIRPTGLTVIFIAFLSIVTLNFPVFADNWLHFGYDDQYTSYNPEETAISTSTISQLERKWGIGCDDGWFSVYYRSPAIYKGKLYTSGAGSNLRVYNAVTGQFLWEFGDGNYGWAPQPVVSEKGVVFYMEGTYPTELYAVNGSTGSQLWKAPLGFELGYSGAAEALVTVDEKNNAVYLVEAPFIGDGKLYAFDITTGEILWYMSKTVDKLDFKDNYVLLDNGTIYARAGVGSEYSAPEHVISINAASQAVKTTYDRPSSLTYHDVCNYNLCNNRLIVGYYYQYGETQYLAGYDTGSAAVAWQREIPAITGKIACNTDKNVIYVPTNPYLYALDAATGNEVWKYKGYDPIYNPSVANGIVYFISDTNMYAVRESNGKKIFSYPLGYDGDETTQVAICNGMLYFSGNGGTCDLFALGFPSPEISVSRTQLYFGGSTSGVSGDSQTFSISQTSGSAIDWSVSTGQSWLSCTPSSGSGSGLVTVSVNAAGLSAGTYNGTVTVTAPGASNSPLTVSVALNVYNAGATQAPFGQFATPVDGSTVSSSVPVTGWVLDDVGVVGVGIYRASGNALTYIGDALFVEGARPDVEQGYPTYPSSNKAGWGYMMLTNFLPNGGNGTFMIHAIATDLEGRKTTLGVKTITVDNLNAVKPFGAIDTPISGGTVSGANFRNVGWVLTPMPNAMPTDGSTIYVIVDGVNLGNPAYNVYREDIATLFPGYANSNGALAYLDFDTTGYSNGVHTIAWAATDDAGNADGIGSRYFTIQNSASNRQKAMGTEDGGWVKDIPVDYAGSVDFIKGYGRDGEPCEIYPDDNGMTTLEIDELERVELQLTPDTLPPTRFNGYQAVGGRFKSLPVGSTLDSERGIFYWQPGVGFVGDYMFTFIETHKNGEAMRKNILIRIVAKRGIQQ